MSDFRLPCVRPACLLLAAALGVVAASNGLAQVSQRAAAPASAQLDSGAVLNARHPERYTVQRGDTMWDIAALFLRDPWYWPEIWQINPQVDNPHLIYPGDVLALTYLDGRPVLQLERTSAGAERLSPRIRAQSLEEAIPTVPYEAIRGFLTRPLVLDRDQLESLPYVVAPRDGLMGSAGRDVYVRRAGGAAVDEIFNVVNVGDPLIDPDDDAVIGYEAIYVGQGRLRRAGDPATVYLTESARETLVGDLLVAEEPPPQIDFVPRAPERAVDGRIISVVDGVSLIGQYHVVVINRGAAHGLEPGHVLRAWQSGAVVRDRVRRGGFGEKVQLPDEPAGLMMVFRTFDRVSYALIMEATNEIRLLDAVRNP